MDEKDIKPWVDMNVKLLKDVSDEIEKLYAEKIKERYTLRQALKTLGDRYDTKTAALWNKKTTILSNIEVMFDGAKGMREYWRKNPDDYIVFKTANKNFRNKHYYFDSYDDNEKSKDLEVIEESKTPEEVKNETSNTTSAN
jgi:hypothetical protein